MEQRRFTRLFQAKRKLDLKDIPELEIIENGIHNIKQWEDIISNEEN